MDEYHQKFQDLLRHLFQFDYADLDFGIYRVINYKRDETLDHVAALFADLAL